MRFAKTCFCAAWLCIATVQQPLAAAEAAPAAIPGFERFHGRGELPDIGGQLLLGELNCTSCHTAEKAVIERLLPKQAPILDVVGLRVRPDYLRDYLNDPHGTKPGTTMPDPFAGWQADEKQAAIEALTHFLASTGTATDQRIAPGAIAKGDDLFHRVGCMACHDSQRPGAKPLPTSAPLANLSAKYTLPGLASFLQDPRKARPAGRMPAMNLEGEEARNLASYLLRDLKDLRLPANLTFELYEGDWSKMPDFSELKPLSVGETSGFEFSFVPNKDHFAVRFFGVLQIPKDGEYKFNVGSDDGSILYIDDKVIVNHDGIHGTTYKSAAAKLTAGKHKLQVDFFEQAGGEELYVQIEGNGLANQPIENLLIVEKPPEMKERPVFKVDAELAKKGKEVFVSVGCASCHQMQQADKGAPALAAAPALLDLKTSGGCLQAEPKKGLPHYSLSDAQRKALVAGIEAIKKPLEAVAPVDRISRVLETFNCYACHQRGELGGVEEARDKYFLTTQKEMGDEGRVPPPLTGVGAKLKPAYLKEFFEKSMKERPYMHTRMPRFGGADVDALHQEFAKVDKLPELKKVEHKFSEREMKFAGYTLVGSKGFSCIKCHTWGGVQATGIQSINMQRMTTRLNQEWFEAYIVNPQAYRPGTRMPSAWPEGQVLLPKMLDGKADTQIRSLWEYLADGSKARIPLGLGRDPIELVAENEAIIYRNFIEGGGPRAIGVGYPEKVNLAFDANNLRPAMLWQGAFIDASKHWVDRGAGFQGPLGENILHLTSGVPLATLADESTAWPGQGAKELGYKFRGYRLDDLRRPTFMYSYGEVEVTDEFVPVVENEQAFFRRTLSFKSKAPVEKLFLRAAADGSIEAGEGGKFIIGKSWSMTIGGFAGKAAVRESGGKRELLIPISLSTGEAKIVQEFVW